MRDAPADFADAVCRLHEDEALWRRLAEAGQNIVRTHFSFAAVESLLVSSLSSLADLSAPVPRSLPRRQAAVLPFNRRIDCGPGTEAEAYLFSGWGAAADSLRWSNERKAQIRFCLEGEAVRARFRALVLPFVATPAPARQRVQVFASDWREPAEFILDQPAATELQVDFVPTGHRSEGISLDFRFPDACSPLALGLSADVRSLGVALLSFVLERA